mgnify:CR=1 FL=1
MKREEFAGSIGDIYQVDLPDGRQVEIVLKETGDLTPPPENAPEIVKRDPFFLIFEGPSGDQLPTGVLTLSGSCGGDYSLSLYAEGYIDNDPEKGLRYYVAIN